MKTTHGRKLGCIVLLALALPGCGVEGHYYVKTDGSPDVLHGVARNVPPALAAAPVPIDLGVTFKSAGRISLSACDALYLSVSKGLNARGRWQVRRLGRPGDDFAPIIAAVMRAPAVRPVTNLSPALQRMLVLVENSPDLSTGTQIDYFLSGMTFGAHSLNKPTDRYDVTIAYRDAAGIDHIYRNHQDLVFATGNKYLGTDYHALDGFGHYDSADAAFNGIVGNSVNGTQRGVVTVGKPQLSRPPPKKQ